MDDIRAKIAEGRVRVELSDGRFYETSEELRAQVDPIRWRDAIRSHFRAMYDTKTVLAKIGGDNG